MKARLSVDLSATLRPIFWLTEFSLEAVNTGHRGGLTRGRGYLQSGSGVGIQQYFPTPGGDVMTCLHTCPATFSSRLSSLSFRRKKVSRRKKCEIWWHYPMLLELNDLTALCRSQFICARKFSPSSIHHSIFLSFYISSTHTHTVCCMRERVLLGMFVCVHACVCVSDRVAVGGVSTSSTSAYSRFKSITVCLFSTSFFFFSLSRYSLPESQKGEDPQMSSQWINISGGECFRRLLVDMSLCPLANVQQVLSIKCESSFTSSLPLFLSLSYKQIFATRNSHLPVLYKYAHTTVLVHARTHTHNCPKKKVTWKDKEHLSNSPPTPTSLSLRLSNHPSHPWPRTPCVGSLRQGVERGKPIR